MKLFFTYKAYVVCTKICINFFPKMVTEMSEQQAKDVLLAAAVAMPSLIINIVEKLQTASSP